MDFVCSIFPWMTDQRELFLFVGWENKGNFTKLCWEQDRWRDDLFKENDVEIWEQGAFYGELKVTLFASK
jgi:hypothetical protein